MATQLQISHGTIGTSGMPGPKGKDGDPGQSATIKVGTVTTGDAGTSAIIINRGTENDAIFDFTIPRGDKGEPGEITGAVHSFNTRQGNVVSQYGDYDLNMVGAEFLTNTEIDSLWNLNL